ncbi:MAG: hypothetical protein II072_07110 [Clostridia bacterium]|nr:hypothetical protein [Clostridia bacterium]MBQ2191519.1 hypothetical protein [Clostridia bacterium]MBQ5488946.1 hypothetical protein [Clostridia bacterium]
MRRALSWIAIVLAAGAFILLCLIWILKINILIPILMFAAALVLLGIVKSMPSDDDGSGEDHSGGTED